MDKFLLRFGRDVPGEWLPEFHRGDLEDDDKRTAEDWMGEEWYPAVSFPGRWIDDHHPVILGLHGKKLTGPRTNPSLKIGLGRKE